MGEKMVGGTSREKLSVIERRAAAKTVYGAVCVARKERKLEGMSAQSESPTTEEQSLTYKRSRRRDPKDRSKRKSASFSFV